MNNRYYVDGWMAFYADTSWMDCPYSPEESLKYRSWHQGWDEAEQDALKFPQENSYEQGT